MVVDEYTDEGVSGTTLDRPELDRMRDDAGMKKFDIIVVNDVDRLARDIFNLAVIQKDLKNKGVSLIFRKIPQDQNNPMYDFIVNQLGAFAQFEKALILDRTRRGRMHKAKVKQVVVGTMPPYGYRYVKKDKISGVVGYYEVFPEQADVVRKIFRMVAHEGKTARFVCRELTRLGIPTPKGGPRWGRSTVMRLLHNQSYIGTTHFNKYESIKSPSPRNNKSYTNPTRQKMFRRKTQLKASGIILHW